jgi:hypothetical protein
MQRIKEMKMKSLDFRKSIDMHNNNCEEPILPSLNGAALNNKTAELRTLYSRRSSIPKCTCLGTRNTADKWSSDRRHGWCTIGSRAELNVEEEGGIKKRRMKKGLE